MYNLIIVEDEEISCNLIKKHIEETPDLNINVLNTFEDGLDAKNYLANESNVHIVLTDIRMYDMSGIELADYINSYYPHIAVIIMSGYTNFEDAKLAIKYNVKDYLTKPFEMSDLDSALKKITDELDEKYSQKALFPKKALTKQQEFICECITDRNLTKEKILEKEVELSFPFSFEKTPCDIVRIEMNNFENFLKTRWNYSKKAFTVSMYNLIAMSFPEAFVYNIFDDDGIYEYVIFRDKPIFYQQLKPSFLLDFDIVIDISSVKEFNNIFEYLDDESEKTQIEIIGDKRDVMEKAKQYINENFHNNITREDVAKNVYLNPVYFARSFKQYTGEKFNDYLLKVRMKKAAELLCDPEIKIYEIAKMTGYENSRYFFRIFKKYMGMTPNDYRKKKINNEGV